MYAWFSFLADVRVRWVADPPRGSGARTCGGDAQWARRPTNAAETLGMFRAPQSLKSARIERMIPPIDCSSKGGSSEGVIRSILVHNLTILEVTCPEYWRLITIFWPTVRCPSLHRLDKSRLGFVPHLARTVYSGVSESEGLHCTARGCWRRSCTYTRRG